MGPDGCRQYHADNSLSPRLVADEVCWTNSSKVLNRVDRLRRPSAASAYNQTSESLNQGDLRTIGRMKALSRGCRLTESHPYRTPGRPLGATVQTHDQARRQYMISPRGTAAVGPGHPVLERRRDNRTDSSRFLAETSNCEGASAPATLERELEAYPNRRRKCGMRVHIFNAHRRLTSAG